MNPQQYAMVGYVSQAPRNPKGRPPNGPASGGMPSYEEMIVAALHDLNEPDGVQPKVIFDYMSAHWPLIGNFRPSASQALGKAFTRGRLQKVANKYRLNPDWEGGPTSRRTTRRPQNQKVVAPHQPPSGTPAYGWHSPGTLPFPMVYGGPPGSSAVAPNPHQAAPRAVARQDSGDEEELDEDVDIGGTEMDQPPYDHENEVDELEDETHSRPTPLPSLRDSLRKLARLLADTLSEQQWGQTDATSIAIRT
ncbi:hypothetical protein BS47DRAFT_1342858 [Hydnum rufescens UP504]|uniref:Histone H1 n=1 Tax=Hydnum rufescens UP504 TaxID=1448309 RepID=A0A9P6AYV7_9AGAM|nr:hypothetical protein BS47DRAFT_1342858 [Hydnum rufescens UP504]